MYVKRLLRVVAACCVCVCVCACVHVQTSCPAGRFNPNTGGALLASCAVCPAGFFCGERTTSPAPCSAGTYNPVASASVESACLGCPAGSFCPVNSSAPRACGSTAVFCPVNASAPSSVAVGSYSDPTGVNAVREVECEPGSFCLAGVKYPCVGGTFSNTVRERVARVAVCLGEAVRWW